MTHDELAGYAVLAGYGLLLLGLNQVFGVRRVVFGVLAIVTFGLTVALGTLKVLAARR